MTDYQLAIEIRNICVKEAKNGFQEALIQGLCAEGAIEAAISAIQRLDIKEAVAEIKASKS